MKKAVPLAIVVLLAISSPSFAGGKANGAGMRRFIDVCDWSQEAHSVYNAGESGMAREAGRIVAEKVAERVVGTVATPVAVKAASALGVTASTGTEIAALGGVAATSATLAAIGGPASAALGTVGIVAAPAVVGGAIVAGVGFAVVKGVSYLLFRD